MPSRAYARDETVYRERPKSSPGYQRACFHPREYLKGARRRSAGEVPNARGYAISRAFDDHRPVAGRDSRACLKRWPHRARWSSEAAGRFTCDLGPSSNSCRTIRSLSTRGALLQVTAPKKNIDARLPQLFADFPKADYEVRAVEAFRAQSSAGGFYQAPSADGSRPGIFYVNTYNLKAQPKFGMETLSLHEAAPGHHFQVAIQQELEEIPRFRRFGTGYVAYQEGWALYAESIGKELGMFTDPYQYYGRLADEMLRAMRLVVDTGLHTRNWTREQSIKYMLTTRRWRERRRAEVERYIAIPGQALGYKIGQLRISELRNKAQQRSVHARRA